MNPLVVIVSNRGPFSFEKRRDGGFNAQRGSGGLVTALGALAERHEVLWIAAAMSRGDQAWAEAAGGRPQNVEGIRLQLVRPGRAQYDRYYNEIANPLLWFIQHQLWDIPRSPSITGETWQAWLQGYLPVNRLFADAVADAIAGAGRPVIVLPQDYHLYLLPGYLRERVGPEVIIQPFVHIPWPGPDAWRILPKEMRDGLLKGLLAADRIGFQTEKDAFNFVQTCRFYLPGAHSHGRRDQVEYHGRIVHVTAYPISVDVDQLEAVVQEPQNHLLKSQLMNFVGDRRLILRVDRTEPSKNILRGLQAYRLLLEKHPEHRGRVQMVALLVPSRMEVDEYQTYLGEIMAESGLINAEYSDPFWEPVRIVVGENYARAIAALQLYDVLLVNPIADGMNLVAKEGALLNQRDGVIILSEHAGAFYELGEHTIPVSPFDVYGIAEAMDQALTMPVEERRRHAEALRRVVRESDVRRWFALQVEDALTAERIASSTSSTPGTPGTV